MKRIYSIFLIAIVFLSSCNMDSKKDPKAQWIEKITELEKSTFNDQTLQYNADTALLVIKEYQKFIEKYPEDSNSTNYLFLGAQLSQSINLYGEAIRKYQSFYNKYPDDKRSAKAHIMVGMIYESKLQDTVSAKQAYELFLEKYPNHKMANDVRALIQLLQLSDKELMNMLKEKSKQD